MYYIRLNIQGRIKYLHNWRCAVFLPDYARGFASLNAAFAYMSDKEVAEKYIWWVARVGELKRKSLAMTKAH